MEQFKQKFIEDAIDLVADLELNILALETSPNDRKLIQEVFRVMHTLKGVSSMYGFDLISKLTHDIETIYDYIREDKSQINSEILNISLKSIDIVRALLLDEKQTNTSTLKTYECIKKQVGCLIDSLNITPTEHIEAVEKIHIAEDVDYRTLRIIFMPDSNIASRGINMQALFDELNQLGQVRVVPRTHAANVIEHEKKFYMYWEIFLSTGLRIEDVESVFVFVEDETQIELITNEHLLADLRFQKKIEELSEQTLPATIEELKSYVALLKTNLLKKIDEQTNKTKKTHSQETDDLGTKTENDAESSSVAISNKFLQEQQLKNIKISSEKLDELMSLVSQLVTSKAELDLVTLQVKNPKLNSVTEKFDKLTKQIRDLMLRVRLVPISHLMASFQRLVRDLSHDLHKQVRINIIGGDTELDKTIIDGITNPLMHIIRNSIDHGIELPDVRCKQGKGAEGVITIEGFNAGGFVILKISDDGCGIDTDKVRAKAIKKGLISETNSLTEREILNLVFTPGFSTTENVSDISGRGVGMDVVMQKISTLRGEVELESVRGSGTIITLKLPQTLSIIDTLLVVIDGIHFLIPLMFVDFCDEKSHKEITSASNQILNLDGRFIPFVYLRKEFDMPEHTQKQDRLVVVKYEERHVALVVDQIIGEHQAVLKPLGEMFAEQEYISGASILGDGSVALVLDTNRLVKCRLQSKNLRLNT